MSDRQAKPRREGQNAGKQRGNNGGGNGKTGQKSGTTKGLPSPADVPTPLLSVTNTTAVPGAALSGSCSLSPGATTDVQVRVLLGTQVLRDWGQAPLDFAGTVPDEEEKEELELSCEAEVLHFRRSRSLRILVLGEGIFGGNFAPWRGFSWSLARVFLVLHPAFSCPSS